jgi:SAM-dependent methyltransferase
MQKFDHCILCNGSNFRIIHRRDQWQYLRCLNCDLVSLHPRPTPKILMKNYEDYLPVQPEEIKAWEIMMKPVIDKSADLIESRTKSHRGRLMDIGCGYGFFLQEMKCRGWKVEGIEISQIGRQFVWEKWDIYVHSQALENLAFPENSFDVITLFYVIEHVLDPLGLLIEVKRVLKPGGLILLRWPHSTPIVRLLGPLSQKLDLYHTPYHLYDFSPSTMEKMLSYCGFREIETIIAGNTKPSNRFNRWVSVILGQVGEALSYLSGGHFLLPGISKTTLAIKLT